MVVLVPEGNLGRVVLELEDLEHIEYQVDDLLELVHELVRTHEHVGVVLGEAADAGEAVELAALLVAVDGTELGVPQRKILVGTRRARVYLAMVRAVHRLEHVLLALFRGVDRLERILAVLGPVAGSYIELLASDMRGDYRKVAVLIKFPAEEVLELESHDGAPREPQRQPEADPGRESEELHLLAELPVVTLLGLFENDEVFVQHGLLREGDAVDSGQLSTLLVAAPVSACDGGQLDGLDRSRAHEVRSAAEVGVVAVAVICDCPVLELGDKFTLVLISFLLEEFHGFRLGNIDSLEDFLFPGEFEHLLLDLREVALRNGSVPEVDIVVEAVFHGRSDAELGARIEGFEGRGHKVGRRMPEDMLALVILPFEESDGRVFFNRSGQVYDLSLVNRMVACQLNFSRKDFLSQSRADALCDLESSYTFFELLLASVWKLDIDHDC